MFSRASCRLLSRPFSSARTCHGSRSHVTRLAIASSTLAGLSLYIYSQKPIFNDNGTRSMPDLQSSKGLGLCPLVWGSNHHHLLSHERDSKECFKFPTPTSELFSSPLRALAFSTKHAGCVDAAGDVYQWGDGFFGENSVEDRRPHLTLAGKDIISLAVSPTRLFALSSTGKIYVLSSKYTHQGTTRQNNGWNIFNRNNSGSSTFESLSTDIALKSGEKFISISAGSDHLIALTSHGRVFTHPITRFANWHGQLGIRKISTLDPKDGMKRLPLELPPRSLRDNGLTAANDYPPVGEAPTPPSSEGKDVGFNDRLFEVPALRGVDAKQVAAGDRTSFVVTRQGGRVLAWGANEFGQLGLGPNLTLPVVAVPTEVVLSRFSERGTLTRCVDIATGGDLTYFVVERELVGVPKIIDVLACGNGQWGGLGNASYSNAQGTPVKAKNISGILEYDSNAHSLIPLKPYNLSVAPGPPTESAVLPSSSGHVLVALDTFPLSHPDPKSDIATDAALSPGRDVLAWGLNHQYQLGNGKRASLNAPAHVPAPDDDAGRLMCKVSQERVVSFAGTVVGRKMRVEQEAVAGPGLSVVYWKIVR